MNVAGIVTAFGRRTDVEGPDSYVFFLADSRHPNHTAVRNVANDHLYVAEISCSSGTSPVRSPSSTASPPPRTNSANKRSPACVPPPTTPN